MLSVALYLRAKGLRHDRRITPLHSERVEMTTFKEFLDEQLEDPAFREAYKAISEEEDRKLADAVDSERVMISETKLFADCERDGGNAEG